MAFVLLSLRRVLHTAVSWKAFSRCLVRLAGKLSFDQELFLIDIKRVGATSVPLFSRSLLEAWQAVVVLRDAIDSSLSIFFWMSQSFLNPIFEEACSVRSFMQKYIDAGCTEVKHFRDPSLQKWKSAADIAVATGVWVH